MLNRRNIRAKVMQEFYSMEQAKDDNLEKALKRLQENTENIYKLYLLLLDLLVKIKQHEEDLLERRKHKYFKTEEDLHPNTKFVENKVLNLLENNENFRDLVHAYKLDKIWENEVELVRYFLDKIKESDYYKRYMAGPERSFEEDKKFVMDIYKNLIAPDPKLHQFLEDWEINWADDVAIANTMVMKTLDQLTPEFGRYSKMPPLYKDESDRQFGRELLLRAWQNKDTLYGMIKDKTLNWDFERISNVDKILMALALAEFLYFPEIPPMATINEYVEIAKEFSTPKSNSFINGILDKIYKELRDRGKLHKIENPKNKES
ncbi:MAG: transcription antitermination factor NusB [Chlorobi bacterium]|nr:transcription antitermination factor NusB [Chlorobiota bacterium]